MASQLVREPDILYTQTQLNAALARALTFDEAVEKTLSQLRQIAAASCGLQWGFGVQARVFGDLRSLPLAPSDIPRERAASVRPPGAPLIVGLRLRGDLLGCLAVGAHSANGELAAIFEHNALAIAATLVALTPPPASFAEGMSLSSQIELDRLLPLLHAAMGVHLDIECFAVILRDGQTGMFEIPYLARNGARLPEAEGWRRDVGLAERVIQERMVVQTRDPAAMIEAYHLPAVTLWADSPAGPWLGLPLVTRGQAIGALAIIGAAHVADYTDAQLRRCAAVVADASIGIENANRYRRSERQARQLTMLNRIGRIITSSLDTQHVPSIIMEQSSELLNVEEGSLLLTDDVTGDLVFAYTTGPIGSRLLGLRLPRGTGLAGYVIETGQSVLVNDVKQDSRFNASTDKNTGFITRALLATPLRGVGGVVGVIEVMNRRDGSPFTADDQRLIEAIADYAVIALENARRFAKVDQALARRASELIRTNDQLQHNLRSLTALNALGMAITTALRNADDIFAMTARGAAEITGAIGTSVVMLEGATPRISVVVGDHGDLVWHALPIVGRVVASGRVDAIEVGLPPELLHAGVRSLLAVPLRATHRTTGCLLAFYAGALPAPSDVETITLFATQAASAVESLDLFTAVRDARDQMASILASTRDGIVLIGSDARVALTNPGFATLAGLDATSADGEPIETLFDLWQRASNYPAVEWQLLARSLRAVMDGSTPFASGELNGGGRVRYLEWSALTALGSGDSRGGTLLAIRDITVAKESEQLRQDLTHMIVHDLRSPLSSVMASIELLVRGVSGDLTDSQRRVLTIANSSAEQMLDMINTLLDISRLEAGRMPLDRNLCDLGRVVENAVAQLTSLAQERRVAVQADIAAPLPPVLADARLLTRVVQNLLANAIKFSGTASRVLVRVELRPADDGAPPALTVAIHDRGVGIAPKDQERIFTKFGQVGERRGGSGLGLTFCKLVIEAHEGAIWVESEVKRGSIFSFALPLAQEP